MMDKKSGALISIFALFFVCSLITNEDQPTKKAKRSDKHVEPTLSINISRELASFASGESIAKDVVNRMLRRCPDMRSLVETGSIRSIRLSFTKDTSYFVKDDGSRFYSDYRNEMFGWKQYLVIKPRVKKSASSSLAGHTLYFYAGGGKKPGLMCGKSSARFLCNMPEDAKHDGETWVSVPEFAAIDAF